MSKFKPSKKSGGQWRHRHKAVYYAAVGATSGLDIAFAGLVFVPPFLLLPAWNHFGLPDYLWITTFAISVIEASTIVLSVVLIKMHVGRRSHADFGNALAPLWCGSLTINFAYLWGSSGEQTGSEVYWQATAAVVGIVLVAMSYLYHIVSLRYVKQASANDGEEADSAGEDGGSGDEQASDASKKSHRHSRRHHRHG
ncbi:hypothetical protein BMF94_1826 [Rhodotorula taiwanensis]|uniref:Uncharacterized protein n=1 Tax=Rhodotorula taiwanensis TaxID=741276 RepID=A0A2S5BEJ9_9BASI|nr:hypothetical protein BMF94_1826 [Rhodotorula taiwanensis]